MKKFSSCREASDAWIMLDGYLCQARTVAFDADELTLYAVSGVTKAAYERHLEKGGMPMPKSSKTMKEPEYYGLHLYLELQELFDEVRARSSRRAWLLWLAHHAHGRHGKTFYYDETVRYLRGARRGALKPIFYTKAELAALPDAKTVARGWNAQAREGERLSAEQVEQITLEVCAMVESELKSRGMLRQERADERKREVER